MTFVPAFDIDEITVGLNKEKTDLQIKVTKGKKKTSKAEGDGKELPPASE